MTLGDADDAFLHTNALTIRSGYEHAATALAELAVIVSEDGMIDIRTNRLLVQ